MKKSQLWTTAIAVPALLAAAVAIAAPTNAATLSIDCTTAPPMVQVPAGDTVEITGCAHVTWTSSATNVTVKAGATTILRAQNVYDYSGDSSILTVSGILNGQGASLELYVTYSQGVGTRYLVSLSGGPASGGGTSSGDAPSAPVEASLSLDLAASGASCTEGSVATGTVGTWLSLPGADDCTSTTTSSAKLLGWATKADFPVEIAQRQIDNGWGAYELFNDEGQMTAVFIPAGGATFVSASTSLHPIWAS